MRWCVILLLTGVAWGQDVGALSQGMPHFQAALAHAEKQRFEDAVKELNLALPYLEKAGDPQLIAMGHMFRGFCLHQLGRHTEALPDYEHALGILTATTEADTEEKAAALNGLATCLLRLGQGERALGHVERALEMQRRLALGLDSQGLAKALNDTAFCLLDLGRPARALELAQASVAMGHRLHPDGHPGLAAALDNLASCFDDLGRFPEALQVRKQALEMTRASYEGDHQQIAQSLANTAYTLQHLGRPGDALPRFVEARAILERLHLKDHREVATALNNQAMCLAELGRREEALPILKQALAMALRLPPEDHPQVAMLRANLGVTHLELGRLEAALGDLNEALAMRRRLFGNEHPDVACTLNDLAQCLKRRGQTDQAIVLLQEALAISRRLNSPLHHIHASNLGITLMREGNLAKEAVPLFEEAITLIEEQRGASMGLIELDRAAYLETLTRYRAYDGLVRAQLQLGHPGEALRVFERGRARSLLDLLGRSRIDPLNEVRRRAEDADDKRLLAELVEVTATIDRSEIEAGLRAQSLTAARARTDLPRKVLRKVLNGCSADLADARRRRSAALRRRARLIKSGWGMAATLGADEIQKMLAPDERMLLYSINDLDGVVILVPPAESAVTGHELSAANGEPLNEEALVTLVDGYRQAIIESGQGDSQDLEAVAHHGHALFRAVVPPTVWKVLKGVRRVYVVPHRALNRVPFEALVTVKGPELQFWLDRGPEVAYGASASTLHWSRRRHVAQRAQKPLREAVALGDAAFPPALPPLPGTRDEVNAMCRHLAPMKVRALLGDKATETELFSAAPRARWLHLATHLLAAEASGSGYGGLMLTAPANPTPQDDGCLRLTDLFEHWRGRLDRCELVVLSACETRLGKELAEEGAFALPRGFQFAGAPSVIASLWRVDDKSTALLFGEFYRRLKSGGGALRAFVEARRTLRRAKPQPYHWAPFIFIGAE